MSDSDKEIRILIVDDQREVARVLRTSLELLERGYIISDVPSGEEAILEIARFQFDLVIADQRLPGMSGLELIERMKKRNAALKSIIITGYDPKDIQSQADKLGVIKILQKPLDTTAFTNFVQDTLHGPRDVAAMTTLSDKLGPIPDIDQDSISMFLSVAQIDLGALALVLVDRKGRILQEHGSYGDDLRFSELAVLLAGTFTTTGEISTYLGDDLPFAFHFYDGGNYDVYSVALGQHYFLALVFPEGSDRQMGSVVRFGTRAARDLMPMVSGEIQVKKVTEAEEEGEQETAPAEKTEETPAPAAEAKAEPAAVVEEDEDEDYDDEEEEPVEITAPESIDLDKLEEAMTTSSDMDMDSFWDSAVEEASKDEEQDDSALSLEDAIKMGLISQNIGEE